MNNYHTHTYRCRHAIGSEKEMVKAAIQEGFTELGFSDHVPLPYFRWHLLKAFPYSITNFHSILSFGKAFLLNGPGMRMPYRERKAHQKEVQSLKQQFQKDIRIYQGYECEYFKEYLPYYKMLLDKKVVDYLIFGNHFDQYSINARYFGRATIKEEDISQYVDVAIEAMETGLFSYFAHPDLFFVGYHEWNDFVEREIYRLLKKAKEKDVILEVNGGGLTRSTIQFMGRYIPPYPNEYFWRIASELGCRVIIGLDAHAPCELNRQAYSILENFCKQLNIKPIETLNIEKEK